MAILDSTVELDSLHSLLWGPWTWVETIEAGGSLYRPHRDYWSLVEVIGTVGTLFHVDLSGVAKLLGRAKCADCAD